MTALSPPDISKTLLTGLTALLFAFTGLPQAQTPHPQNASETNIPERIIRIGFLDHSEPLVLKEDNQLHGILIDMFSDALAPPGVRFEMKVMPYARIIAELMAGHLDMTVVGRIPGRVKLPPTDQLVITQPLIISPIYLYARADRNIIINKPTDIGNYHFGGVRLREIKDPPPTPGNPKISYFKSPSYLYKSLAAGRIDVALAGPVVTGYWEKQLNTEFREATPFGNMYSHFAFSVKSLGEDVYPICQKIVQQWSNSRAKLTLAASTQRYQSQLLTEFVRIPPESTPIEELCFTVKKYLEYEKQNPQILKVTPVADD